MTPSFRRGGERFNPSRVLYVRIPGIAMGSSHPLSIGTERPSGEDAI